MLFLRCASSQSDFLAACRRFNAPLVPIDCFDNVAEFMRCYRAHAETGTPSPIHCIELTGTAVSLHSATALTALSRPSMFLVVGSENQGVHSDILQVRVQLLLTRK